MSNQIPPRIFFVHRLKCAGVYTNLVLTEALQATHDIYDPWRMGYNQDWTPKELREIIVGAGKQNSNVYLHQHHPCVTKEDLFEAQAHGWVIVTFLRHPADVLCSMFYWMKGLTRNGQLNPIFPRPDPLGLWGMPRFWQGCLEYHMRHLWAPPLFGLYSYCPGFSEFALSNWLTGIGIAHRLLPEPVNTSSNPGLVRLMELGIVTQQMLDDLHATSEFKAYGTIFSNKTEVPIQSEVGGPSLAQSTVV